MAKLTVGFAVHNDFDGACFTLQAIRMYHPEVLRDLEVVVVDNAPDGSQGKALQNLLGWFGHHKEDIAPPIYVPFTEYEGTSGPRDRIFRIARTDAVLCLDSHVLLPAEALRRLIDYYAAHPRTMDLLSGPMLGDNMLVMATHFDDFWRGEMWGIWGRAWRCRCGRQDFSTIEDGPDIQFRRLVGATTPITSCPQCQTELPRIPWPGHERHLEAVGLYPIGGDGNDLAFEIPAMGLGLFSCRKEAWERVGGFNPKFRGFGGEEFYIHEKFRRAGARCLCLPFLRWWHRFYRERVPYPLSTWLKVRNYVLGHQEIGKPLDELKRHFGSFPSQQWTYAEQGIEWPPDAPENPPRWCQAPEWYAARSGTIVQTPPQSPPPVFEASDRIKPAGRAPCKPCQRDSVKNLDSAYESAAQQPSEMNEHVPTLRELATGCDVVVDFGARPHLSTVALLAGRPKRLLTHAGSHGLAQAAQEVGVKVETPAGNSLSAEPVECDLLFFDTKHTADYNYAELSRHAPLCRGRIAFHDSELYGERGEDGGPGLLPALRKYLRDHPEWTVIRHDKNNHGLLVLSRRDEDKKELPPLWQQGWNFIKASARQVAAGGVWGDVEEETMEERLALCMVCPSRNGERCGECGCPLEKKVSWPREQCPLGHWGPVEEPTVKEETRADATPS